MLSSRNWWGPFRLLLNGASGCGHASASRVGEKASWWGLTRVTGQAGPVQVCRHYPRNPLERLSMEQLKAAVGGGRGGRGGRGRKKGGKKGMREAQDIWVGQGVGGVRWPGLSLPMEQSKYSIDWLKQGQLGMRKVEMESLDEKGKPRDRETEDKGQFMIQPYMLEGRKKETRRVSEIGWDRRGWTGTQWGGRYVGCPELPDGTPVEDFKSVAIKVKRVANQTKSGKKRTLSALVVVGNGNGMAGFAVGRGDEIKAAIRKAKNKALNYLQFVPRCDSHTIYHNVKVKYCKTNIEMERRVRGHGLRCHRVVSAICKLVGIEDMRAKVTGSTNPLNTVRATFKGLTSQETFQDLADQTGQFVVEYRRECLYRPVVVAAPSSEQGEECWRMLRDLQLVPHTASPTSAGGVATATAVEGSGQSQSLVAKC